MISYIRNLFKPKISEPMLIDPTELKVYEWIAQYTATTFTKLVQEDFKNPRTKFYQLVAKHGLEKPLQAYFQASYKSVIKKLGEHLDEIQKSKETQK